MIIRVETLLRTLGQEIEEKGESAKPPSQLLCCSQEGYS